MSGFVKKSYFVKVIYELSIVCDGINLKVDAEYSTQKGSLR
jgi:hypothetical protein